MLKSIFDVEEAVGKPINGVDNPNVMSVDSTAVFADKVDEVSGEDERLEHPELLKEKEDKKKKEEEANKKVLEDKDEGEDDELTEEEKLVKAEKDKKDKFEKVPEAVQKRIDKAVKNQRVAERERDFFKNKLQELEAENLKLKSQSPVTGKPKREDFESDDEYNDSLIDWRVEQKLKTKQEETDKGKKTAEDLQAETELQEMVTNLITIGQEKYDDWDTTAGDKDLKITPALFGVILESAVPEDIMHFLGLNPDLAEEFSAMTVKKAAIEIGKIEVKLAEEPDNVSEDLDKDKEETKEKAKPKPVVKIVKKVSSAPDPIKSVKTTGLTERDPKDMSAKEYRAWREGQKK